MAKNKLGIYREGLFRRNVVVISTGSTNYDISAKESGSLFRIAEATTVNFRLPKVSSLALGLTYEFAILEQASSLDIRITCNTFDSSALIQSGFSSVVDNATTVIPNSTMFTGARITAVSTIVWMLEQITGLSDYFGSTAGDNEVCAWTTG